MYKGRLGTWALAIIMCLVVSFAMEWVPVLFKSDDLNISIDLNNDTDMAQILSNTKINKIKLYVNNENSEVLITTNDMVNTEGYTVYKDMLYSPIVMYARGVYSYDDGFISVVGSSYVHRVDLYSILTAMEQGKEWKDLGFNKYVANGPITLYIPNEQCVYYNDVVELFYITLNNGKVPDDETRAELTQRVSNILAKCHMVADVGQAINDEYADPSKEHKVFIGPEYLYQRGKTNVMGKSSDSSSKFAPVYFQTTLYLTANIYVKNVESDENIGTKLIENMKAKPDFLNWTGWRVKNSTFDLNGAYLERP